MMCEAEEPLGRASLRKCHTSSTLSGHVHLPLGRPSIPRGRPGVWACACQHFNQQKCGEFHDGRSGGALQPVRRAAGPVEGGTWAVGGPWAARASGEEEVISLLHVHTYKFTHVYILPPAACLPIQQSLSLSHASLSPSKMHTSHANDHSHSIRAPNMPLAPHSHPSILLVIKFTLGDSAVSTLLLEAFADQVGHA